MARGKASGTPNQLSVKWFTVVAASINLPLDSDRRGSAAWLSTPWLPSAAQKTNWGICIRTRAEGDFSRRGAIYFRYRSPRQRQLSPGILSPFRNVRRLSFIREGSAGERKSCGRRFRERRRICLAWRKIEGRYWAAREIVQIATGYPSRNTTCLTRIRKTFHAIPHESGPGT